MEKLLALLDLFRKGDRVADPVLWKTGGITVMALIPLLLAVDRVAASFGFPLNLDAQAAGDIATGVIAVVGIVTHVVSSGKIGLPAKRLLDDPEGQPDPSTYRGS